ncbi:hypothetical protein R0135_14395 [Congregibacter variabilis]|uniref:Uncharacterized protein n=1 Tax=Congregibacter variabilis TaxID=3081200 RepID=A0ABZ0I0B4_9GAMM|nr:hypothetical protein R0135_14395 [Congregibacter sp. IMCC43200]
MLIAASGTPTGQTTLELVISSEEAPLRASKDVPSAEVQSTVLKILSTENPATGTSPANPDQLERLQNFSGSLSIQNFGPTSTDPFKQRELTIALNDQHPSLRLAPQIP